MPDLDRHHDRIRRRGVNAPVYWVVRAVLQPLIRLYFRLRRNGRGHIPRRGAVILASNHRSFLDPFAIGCCLRRPIYFMAKRELFERRHQGWLLNALGAFPVRRGEADEESMETARVLLSRGEAVVIFPEGTRVRHGSLGQPRRGLGRLALESGAPVVPVAVEGTERARRTRRSGRRGLLIRPVRVGVRCGRPLRFPRVDAPSPRLAAAVTGRIWPFVALQWEWLGGLPPLRKAAVVGAGPMGRALAEVLARGGLEVQLGCRDARQAGDLPARDGLVVKAAGDVELGGVDLVALAVPSRDLPTAVGEVGDRITSRTAVLVVSKGLVPPLGTTPTRYVGERVRARSVSWLGGPAHAAEMVSTGASLVFASGDADLSRELVPVLRAAGLDVETCEDVVGAELAGCAKNVAVLAAAAAAPVGMNAAGAAAGQIFGEVHGLALERGAAPRTFSGLAGTGDLVATALAESSRNRRAGELLAGGLTRDEIAATLGAAAEALDAAPLLADVLSRDGLPASGAANLAALVEGRLSSDEWIARVRREPALDARCSEASHRRPAAGAAETSTAEAGTALQAVGDRPRTTPDRG